MLGESVAYPIHATFCPSHRRRRTWTSNARTNLRTKKRVLAKHAHLADRARGRAGSLISVLAHFDRWTCLAKMPLLQLPNCQRSSVAEATTRSHATEHYSLKSRLLDLPMDRGRQESPKMGRLTSLWPLAVAAPPMSCAPSVESQNIPPSVGRVKCRAR
jgi:hypothetical protein